MSTPTHPGSLPLRPFPSTEPVPSLTSPLSLPILKSSEEDDFPFHSCWRAASWQTRWCWCLAVGRHGHADAAWLSNTASWACGTVEIGRRSKQSAQAYVAVGVRAMRGRGRAAAHRAVSTHPVAGEINAAEHAASWICVFASTCFFFSISQPSLSMMLQFVR